MGIEAVQMGMVLNELNKYARKYADALVHYHEKDIAYKENPNHGNEKDLEWARSDLFFAQEALNGIAKSAATLKLKGN